MNMINQELNSFIVKSKSENDMINLILMDEIKRCQLFIFVILVTILLQNLNNFGLFTFGLGMMSMMTVTDLYSTKVFDKFAIDNKLSSLIGHHVGMGRVIKVYSGLANLGKIINCFLISRMITLSNLLSLFMLVSQLVIFIMTKLNLIEFKRLNVDLLVIS